ncbi:hypothetical protein C8R45DRAFT_941043 [Mycena sanguinolenta]|nr:hypothetical protein C8R45DRAFT_941043 [Mycena sanguinolenta]
MSAPVPTLFGLRQSDTPSLELFLEDPERFTFDVLPFVFTTGDFISHAERPLFPVCAVEIDPIDPIDDQSFCSVYFLLHPAVIRLLPFLRVPARVNFTSLEYLADLLDSAVPAFHAFAASFDHVPRTGNQGRLLRALTQLALHIREVLPTRFNEEWMAVACGRELNVWLLDFGAVLQRFRFPGVTEFAADHPRMPFLLTPEEHQFFLAYSTPSVLTLVSYINDPTVRPSTADIVRTINRCRTFFNALRQVRVSAAISLILVDAFANSIRSIIGALPLEHRNHDWLDALPVIPNGELIPLPPSFSFPTTPHWTEDPDPFPLFDDEVISDPLSLAWETFMTERHAAMPTPHSPSPPPISSHANSPLPLGLSAIDESQDDQVQDPPADIILSPPADPIDTAPSPPIASTTPLPENEAPQSPETVGDHPFLSLDTPAPPKFRRGNKRGRASSPTPRRTTSPPLKKTKVSKRREVSPIRESTPGPSTRVLRRSVHSNRQATAPPPKKASAAPAKRPVIKTRASRKSTTPPDEYIPPVEALDEGESEVEDEDNPQDDTLRGRRIRADGKPVRGLGKESQPFVGSRTQLPVEALGFALRDYQHVKRKMTNSVPRIILVAPIAWPAVSSALARVPESKLAHIILDFDRAHEDLLALEAVYSRTQLRFDLAARVLGDWMQGILASYGPQALPGMDLVPAGLRDTWLAVLDTSTRALQNGTEPALPMLDVPVGAAPEVDTHDFLAFLHNLDARIRADPAGKISSRFPIFFYIDFFSFHDKTVSVNGFGRRDIRFGYENLDFARTKVF